MMRTIVRFLMVAIVALGLMPALVAETQGTGKTDEKEPFKRLTVDEVAKMIKDPNVHVYDGNRDEVYKENHVPGAVLLYSKDIKEGVLPAKKETALIFYCHNEL
jgi:hypothetical protein